MAFFKKSIAWLDDRTGFSESIWPIVKHPVPPDTGWAYVFGSGVLFCFTLQLITGIALAFLYQPSVESAYDSLQYIQNHAFMGKFIRGLHFFGASGMVVLVGLHMIRVYLTASYKFPREMSWITGIFLLLLVIAMGFTGQLLRWDNEAVWSTYVAAEQFGRIPIIGDALAYLLIAGKTVNGFTLNRFFSFHVFVFPGLMIALIGLHLYLVIRNGISEPPKVGRLVDPKTYRKWYKEMLDKKGVPFFPDAAWRDVIFALSVFVVLVTFALVVGAPAPQKPPNPSEIIANPSPDWYLKWIFAIYAMMPPWVEPYLIFFGPLIVIAFLLAYPFVSNRGERSPLRRPWSFIGVALTVGLMIYFTVVGNIAPWSPRFDTMPIAEKFDYPAEFRPGAHLFYDKGCQYCHKINETGGLHGPDLTEIGRYRDLDQIRLQIVNGGEGMPAYGGILSGTELDTLTNFLKNMPQNLQPVKKEPLKTNKESGQKNSRDIKNFQEQPAEQDTVSQ